MKKKTNSRTGSGSAGMIVRSARGHKAKFLHATMDFKGGHRVCGTVMGWRIERCLITCSRVAAVP